MFFSLIVLLQLRWPIESKYAQIWYVMHVGIHQVRILVFDNIIPKVSSAFKSKRTVTDSVPLYRECHIKACVGNTFHIRARNLLNSWSFSSVNPGHRDPEMSGCVTGFSYTRPKLKLTNITPDMRNPITLSQTWNNIFIFWKVLL